MPFVYQHLCWKNWNIELRLTCCFRRKLARHGSSLGPWYCCMPLFPFALAPSDEALWPSKPDCGCICWLRALFCIWVADLSLVSKILLLAGWGGSRAKIGPGNFVLSFRQTIFNKWFRSFLSRLLKQSVIFCVMVQVTQNHSFLSSMTSSSSSSSSSQYSSNSRFIFRAAAASGFRQVSW